MLIVSFSLDEYMYSNILTSSTMPSSLLVACNASLIGNKMQKYSREGRIIPDNERLPDKISLVHRGKVV